MIQGTGGLRKMRFAAPGSQRGKSKSFRVCYVDFTEFGFIGRDLRKLNSRTLEPLH